MPRMAQRPPGSRTARTAATAAIVLAIVVGGGRAQSALVDARGGTQAGIAASGAWVGLPAAGETSAVLQASLDNPTMYDMYVVGGAAEVAGRVELRDKATAVSSLTVPAYGSLRLDASGPHVALVGLTRALKTGETIEVSIALDGAPAVRVSAIVKER